jgi:hypothetical protein
MRTDKGLKHKITKDNFHETKKAKTKEESPIKISIKILIIPSPRPSSINYN